MANFGILAMCGLLVASITSLGRWRRDAVIEYQLLAGAVFGATTAALILFSSAFPGGAVFDSRAAPALLSGVIGGPWAALVTAALGVAARIFVGGALVTPGVVSVAFYCAFGWLFAVAVSRLLGQKVGLVHLAPLGLISSVLALPIFFIGVPFETALTVVEAVFPTVLLTNVVSVVALGVILMKSIQIAKDRRRLLVMQSAIERAGDGVVIADVDDDNRIIYANEAATRITGISQKDMIGTSKNRLFSPENADDDLSTSMDFGREGEAMLSNAREDGDIDYHRIKSAPVIAANGEVTHWVSVLSDVSHEMRVQNVLKTVSSQLPIALIYLKLDGKVEFMNGAAIDLLGLNGDSFQKRPVHNVVSASVLETLAPFIFDASKGKAMRSECELQITAKRSIDAFITSAPTRMKDGSFTGVILSVEDITSRKQVSQMKSDRLQSLGTLISGIAHDFNNLNTVVIGNLDLLKLSADTPDAAEFIDEALAAARRGAQLTQSLLSFGRKAMLRPNRLDLRERVEELEDLLTSSVKAAAAIDVTGCDASLEVDVDQTSFETAILNLALNADHAVRDNAGSIRIALRRVTLNAPLSDGAFAGDLDIDADGHFAAITVADTGTGVPIDSREKIIEPFYTTKGRHSGTGLGLAMVHGFARQSGGFLRIADNRPSGTVVTLYLPIAEQSDSPASAQHVGDAPPLMLKAG